MSKLQLKQSFTVTGENLKKKQLIGPKIKVMFFDIPPTFGEIHHNQIFNF